MFRGTFAGRTIYSTEAARRFLAEHGTPHPPEFEKANSLLNPLGPEAARGWVLMLRNDLNEIDLNGLHTLTFEMESEARNAITDTMVSRNLCIAREPINLSTGIAANDPRSLYLVEVADARWRVCNPVFQIPINASFNVRGPSPHGGNGAAANYFTLAVDSANVLYCADSLSGGTTAYTWTTMIQAIWATMSVQLGAAPTLPYTPDGTPDGWVFNGVPAWLALTQVLHRIGCAVKADLSLSSNQYSIVRVGAADTASDAIITIAEAQNRRIHDAEPLSIVHGKIPGSVQVFFPWQEVWDTRSLASKTIAGTYSGTASVDSNSVAVLWDDLKAILNTTGDGYSNDSALTTRATERADSYYRMVDSIGGTVLWKRYSGLLALSPGSTIKGVGWSYRSNEEGVFTELVRHPFAYVGVSDAGRWQAVPGPTLSTESIGSDFDPNIVIVKNATGAAAARYAVLALGSPLIAQTDNAVEFKRTLTFAGTTPAATTDRVAVLLEPLASNKIGRAVVCGVVPVQVNVTDAAHTFATPTASDNTKLTSAASGPIELLSKESGTGTKWAYAHLTSMSSGGLTSPLTTKGDIWTYSTTDDRLPVGASTTYLSPDSGESTGLKWKPFPDRVTSVCAYKNSLVATVSSPVTINSTSYTSLCSASWTLQKATNTDISLHLFWDGGGMATAGDVFEAIIKVDGSALGQKATWRVEGASSMGHVSQRWYPSATAATHTLEAFAKRVSGSGQISVTVDTDFVAIAETVITREITNAAGTETCTPDPTGCCNTTPTSYEANDCSSSTSLTIPSVTLAAGELLIVDFVAATSTSPSITATFDGNAMSLATSANYTTGSYPVHITSLYYVAGAATGNVVISYSSLPKVAARATRIANCSNAPYGTSTNSGASSQPITGTLGGTNTLPGQVHAAFVLGNPTTTSTWTSPFIGEADDLTWCTDYRLTTGGTPALTSTQTFTASLDGVTPSSWAGLELYLLLD